MNDYEKPTVSEFIQHIDIFIEHLPHDKHFATGLTFSASESMAYVGSKLQTHAKYFYYDTETDKEKEFIEFIDGNGFTIINMLENRYLVSPIYYDEVKQNESVHSGQI